ncbi:YggT family protein [Candidiatus Paracoxiella cheracis]|uniref:YggT family protein n=1 Tax=Candidiatus Paracoxiella cheracis TaxID=3405120 RepID=UPI003BF61D45
MFLVDLVFDIYIIILIVRLLMQKLGASYHNPFSQLIIKLTNVFVTPMQKVLPGFKGFDFAIIFLILLFAVIETLLTIWLRFKVVPGLWGTIVISIGMIGNKFVNLYFYAIIVRAIMSWVVSLQQSPIAEVVFLITEPIMKPARRLIPTIAGFDLSPIPVLIALQLISAYGFGALINTGMKLAFT